jgi:biotin transport system substrate-specific component
VRLKKTEDFSVEKTQTNRIQTWQLVLCALFAAVTAILSQLAIPIGPVPINLATFSVFCAGALLGSRLGALSQLIYVLLGAVGVPVFAMFTGGVGRLTGPTGGFIVGYAAAAWIVGTLARRWGDRFSALALAMAAGAGSYFLLGSVWFMIVTQSDLSQALMACVIPFLPGDALKILLAATLTRRLRPIMDSRLPSVKK